MRENTTPTVELLNWLRSRGVTLRVDGPDLLASPRSALTDLDRETIREHKAELVAWLTAPDDPPAAALIELDRLRAELDRLIAVVDAQDKELKRLQGWIDEVDTCKEIGVAKTESDSCRKLIELFEGAEMVGIPTKRVQ